MRTIDADALIERLENTQVVGELTIGVLKQLVYTAPTVNSIEERIARLESTIKYFGVALEQISRGRD